jgi:hypothetical protein
MRSLSLFLAAVALAATPADAQFRQQAAEQDGLGFTADLLFAQMGGTIGDSIGIGFGLAAAGFFQFPQAPARLGAGASYTRFSTDELDGAHNKLSVFATGSWHIADPNTTVVPYLQGQVGYVRLDDDATTCAAFPDEEPPGCTTALAGREWSGLELGAAVGVDIPMTETLNIDVGGTFSWLTLGDLTAGGQAIDGTSTNVSTFGMRAGVTIFPR